MDRVEPTSHEPWEFQVLKGKLFEIEPRKNKLNPHECCNIRFRYNIKEKGTHWLGVIFQITNGKPLISGDLDQNWIRFHPYSATNVDRIQIRTSTQPLN